MKKIQKTFSFIIFTAILSALFVPVGTAFALSQEEFADVLCSRQQGPAADGETAASLCKKKALETGEVVIGGKTFKFSDYKDLSKDEFQAKAEDALGLTEGSLSPPSRAAATGNSKCKTVILNVGCDKDAVMKLLGLILDIMTVGVGIAAVGGIAFGSLLYTTAGGSQDQVKKAIGIIQNVVIGLVAYACLYAFLQFILPGGAF